MKGYGPHVQNMDRTRYRQELNRETFLQIAGFRVVAVPYDDLEENPELTISLLRSLLTPCYGMIAERESFTRLECEIIRVAIRWDGFIRPTDWVRELGINQRSVMRNVKTLCEKWKLRPIITGNSSRICRYEYVHSLKDNQLW